MPKTQNRIKIVNCLLIKLFQIAKIVSQGLQGATGEVKREMQRARDEILRLSETHHSHTTYNFDRNR